MNQSAGLPQDQVGAVATLGVVSSLTCLVWISVQFAKYARKDTPRSYLAVVGMCWWLGVIGVVVLLPVDIAVSEHAHGRADSTMMTLWKFEYWLTFVLSWIVCPLMMEYWASGAFTFRARFLEALRSNLKFYLAAFAILAIFAVAIAMTRGLDALQLTGYLLAAANCYGMLLIVVMIGYGLIELPRLMWSRFSHKNVLERLYFAAPLVEGERFDAETDVTEVVKGLGSFHSALQNPGIAIGPNLSSQILEVCSKVPSEFESVLHNSSTSSAAITSSELAKLHARLKKALVGYERAVDSWNVLLAEVGTEEKRISIEETSTIGSSASQPLQPQVTSRTLCSLGFIRSMCSWDGILLLCASGFSIVLFWCECNAPFRAELSIFGASVHAAETAFAVQLASLVPLLYMATCAYTALFKFKMLDGLALHRNNHTDVYCLLYNASYMGRLQFALGINFAAMLYPESMGKTQFHKLMGNTDVAPFLGTDFNQYIPILMIIVALMTWVRALDKMFNALGIEVHMEPQGTPEHQERIEEGIRLVRNAQQRRGRGLNSLDQVVEAGESGLLRSMSRWVERVSGSGNPVNNSATLPLTRV